MYSETNTKQPRNATESLLKNERVSHSMVYLSIFEDNKPIINALMVHKIVEKMG